MTGIQFIERNGRREYAIVPMPLFTRMAALLEDLDDEALYDKAKAAEDGFRVPGAVVSTLLAGTHPVKAWREHAGFTQDVLAAKACAMKVKFQFPASFSTFLACSARQLCVPCY